MDGYHALMVISIIILVLCLSAASADAKAGHKEAGIQSANYLNGLTEINHLRGRLRNESGELAHNREFIVSLELRFEDFINEMKKMAEEHTVDVDKMLLRILREYRLVVLKEMPEPKTV